MLGMDKNTKFVFVHEFWMLTLMFRALIISIPTGIGMIDHPYHDPSTSLLFEVREFESCDHDQHLKDKTTISCHG
jgi:hypothetical protein